MRSEIMSEWPTGTVSGRYSGQRPNITEQESRSLLDEANKEVQDWQEEIFNHLMDFHFSDIEQRSFYGTRGTGKSTMLPYYGTCPAYCIMDEYHDIKEPVDNVGPKKMYWTQSIPTADPFNKPVSDPSQAKRAKLRAKRKKR
jgi:hypothetical protein